MSAQLRPEIQKDKTIKEFLRQQEIDSGFYNKPATVFFKDKSKYSRKEKHKKDYE